MLVTFRAIWIGNCKNRKLESRLLDCCCAKMWFSVVTWFHQSQQCYLCDCFICKNHTQSLRCLLMWYMCPNLFRLQMYLYLSLFGFGECLLCYCFSFHEVLLFCPQMVQYLCCVPSSSEWAVWIWSDVLTWPLTWTGFSRSFHTHMDLFRFTDPVLHQGKRSLWLQHCSNVDHKEEYQYRWERSPPGGCCQADTHTEISIKLLSTWRLLGSIKPHM